MAVVQLRVPKAEFGSETPRSAQASCTYKMPVSGVQQLRVPKAEFGSETPRSAQASYKMPVSGVQQLRVPKAEPRSETPVSCNIPTLMRNGMNERKASDKMPMNGVQQLRVPKAEPRSETPVSRNIPTLMRNDMKESKASDKMSVNGVQQLRVPKAEVGNETASVMAPLRIDNNPYRKVVGDRLLSPKRVLFPAKCDPGSICTSLSSPSASLSSSEDKSGSEFDAGDSSNHSDRSDSDEEEYKVSEDEDEEEESRLPKRQKLTKSEGKSRSHKECPEASLQKKCRVKTTAQRTDSFAPRTRTTNPGRRKVGKRIYDSVLGRTCHWCRQKTVELHVQCARCPIRFCGACLLNRNGENIEMEMLVRWICPKCRGGCGKGCKNCCNCGPCRKAQGFGPTGQLVNVARKFGYNNVHDYLVYQKTNESVEEIASRKEGCRWTRESGARVKISFEDRKVKVGKGDRDAKREVKEEAENYSEPSDAEMEDEDEDEEDYNEQNYGKCGWVEEVVEEAENYGKSNVFPWVMEAAENPSKPSDLSQYTPRTPSIRGAFREKPVDSLFQEKPVDSIFQGDGIAQSCSDFSGSQFIPRTPPVKTSSRDNRAENTETDSPTAYGRPFSCTLESTQSDFGTELEATLRRPFSTHQLKEMWEHANYRKPVMKIRQTRSRVIEVPSDHLEGRSYLDHYPDLATKLAKAISPEDKLQILRGFFFWLQHSCMDGSYRPWRDAQAADNTGDCTEIDGPDCQIIRVLLAIDEDEENVPVEQEDRKPVLHPVHVRPEREEKPKIPVLDEKPTIK